MKVIFLAILFLINFGCTKATPESDFKALCDTFTKHGYPEVIERPKDLAKMFEELKDKIKTDEVKEIFQALAAAPPEHKYQYMKLHAAGLGLKDWSCPVLEKEN